MIELGRSSPKRRKKGEDEVKEIDEYLTSIIKKEKKNVLDRTMTTEESLEGVKEVQKEIKEKFKNRFFFNKRAKVSEPRIRHLRQIKDTKKKFSLFQNEKLRKYKKFKSFGKKNTKENPKELQEQTEPEQSRGDFKNKKIRTRYYESLKKLGRLKRDFNFEKNFVEIAINSRKSESRKLFSKCRSVDYNGMALRSSHGGFGQSVHTNFFIKNKAACHEGSEAKADRKEGRADSRVLGKKLDNNFVKKDLKKLQGNLFVTHNSGQYTPSRTSSRKEFSVKIKNSKKAKIHLIETSLKPTRNWKKGRRRSRKSQASIIQIKKGVKRRKSKDVSKSQRRSKEKKLNNKINHIMVSRYGKRKKLNFNIENNFQPWKIKRNTRVHSQRRGSSYNFSSGFQELSNYSYSPKNKEKGENVLKMKNGIFEEKSKKVRIVDFEGGNKPFRKRSFAKEYMKEHSGSPRKKVQFVSPASSKISPRKIKQKMKHIESLLIDSSKTFEVFALGNGNRPEFSHLSEIHKKLKTEKKQKKMLKYKEKKNLKAMSSVDLWSKDFFLDVMEEGKFLQQKRKIEDYRDLDKKLKYINYT